MNVLHKWLSDFFLVIAQTGLFLCYTHWREQCYLEDGSK